MTVSLLTLLINAALVGIGIILMLILIRLGGRHEYYYGVSDVQAPIKRWMMILLLTIMTMSFIAGIYNLVGPWLFGL